MFINTRRDDMIHIETTIKLIALVFKIYKKFACHTPHDGIQEPVNMIGIMKNME
jgi:hypothetical protein